MAEAKQLKLEIGKHVLRTDFKVIKKLNIFAKTHCKAKKQKTKKSMQKNKNKKKRHAINSLY